LKKDLADSTNDDVRDFLLYLLREKGKSHAYVNQSLSALKFLLTKILCLKEATDRLPRPKNKEPFWVGMFEKYEDDHFSVCRVVFGAEPKDYEVYNFVQKEYYNLKFSNPLLTDVVQEKRTNIKRIQREVKKEVGDRGIGTKAQLAMKLQYETNIVERRKRSKEEKEREKEKQYVLRQEKKKEKHKGH